MSLPSELLLLIPQHLLWPDLLALKHTHPFFYHSVQTTLQDRVEWLIDRGAHDLPFPRGGLILKSDELFCRNTDIRDFIRRRRRHLDCLTVSAGSGRCLVLGDNVLCPQAATVGATFDKDSRAPRWMVVAVVLPLMRTLQSLSILFITCRPFNALRRFLRTNSSTRPLRAYWRRCLRTTWDLPWLLLALALAMEILYTGVAIVGFLLL